MSLATVGHNFDVDSFMLVAQAMLRGENVYIATARYNYAPPWSSILFILAHVHAALFPILSYFTTESFHLVVAGFLSLVDVGLGSFLAIRFGFWTGTFFLLSPISILITGYHSQFDNLAVLVGLCSWFLIANPQGRTTPTLRVASALLLGLSLSIKQVFLFMPLWILCWREFGRPLQRLLYAALAYATFAAMFLPWMLETTSMEAVIRNVLLYRSQSGGILPVVSQIVIGADTSAWTMLFQVTWFVSLVVVGWFVTQRRANQLPFLYLASFVGLAPAMADQYLAIPLATIALHVRDRLSWAYTAVGTIALIVSPSNINWRAGVELIRSPPLFGVIAIPVLMASLAQAALVALVVATLRQRERQL